MYQKIIKVDKNCTLCGYCQMICPQQAISIGDAVKIDQELCTLCETCVSYCPVEALRISDVVSNQVPFPTIKNQRTLTFDVVVVGAGLGGLLAAAFLCKQGKKVAIIEKCDFIGGRFTGIDFQGYQISTGAVHMIPHGRSGPLSQALSRLEIDINFADRDVWASFNINGKHYIAKRAANVFTMLSIREKFDLAKIIILLKYKKRLPVEISFGQWLLKQTKSKNIFNVFNKFINFSVSVQSDEVSYNEIRYLFKNIKDLGLPQVPKGGCKSIIEKLREFISNNGGQIFCSEAAEEIILSENRVSGVKSINKKSSTSSYFKCKSIISDIGVAATIRLLGNKDIGAHVEWCNLPVAKGLKLYFSSDISMIPHRGIMFCLDSQGICGILQPTNASPDLAPEGKHLIIAYQVCQSEDRISNMKIALDDLSNVFGPGFQKHCTMINFGYFNDGWPVNKAKQGSDYRSISLIPGLYLVGDDCKPEGYVMAEGVAKSVEAALAQMQSEQ